MSPVWCMSMLNNKIKGTLCRCDYRGRQLNTTNHTHQTYMPPCATSRTDAGSTAQGGISFSLFYNADNAKHNTARGQCCMKASLNIYDAGRNKFIARISHTVYAPQKKHSFKRPKKSKGKHVFLINKQSPEQRLRHKPKAKYNVLVSNH